MERDLFALRNVGNQPQSEKLSMINSPRTKFYAIRALWKIFHGRWFVLRNSPDDVVANIAALDLRDDDAPEIKQLVTDAKTELALRLKNLKREIESAIREQK